MSDIAPEVRAWRAVASFANQIDPMDLPKLEAAIVDEIQEAVAEAAPNIDRVVEMFAQLFFSTSTVYVPMFGKDMADIFFAAYHAAGTDDGKATIAGCRAMILAALKEKPHG